MNNIEAYPIDQTLKESKCQNLKRLLSLSYVDAEKEQYGHVINALKCFVIAVKHFMRLWVLLIRQSLQK